jgi:predicted NAD/FAD-binding protein
MVKARGHEATPYDAIFLACHSGQALALLADADAAEREILGALPFQRNEAVLHTDTALLPRRRLAWAAWNYHVLPEAGQRVALTYNMNILQGLRSRHTFCVTLNRGEAIDPSRVLKRLSYHHPLFTPEGVAAQRRHGEISGVHRTHYCGAYWRYGFHEDGVVSALTALQRFEQRAHDAQRDLPRVA